MPKILPRGERAPVTSILDGDPVRQREALWSYLARGKEAPGPRPLPPIPVAAPSAGAPPLVAQVPIHLSDGAVVEAIAVLSATHDLLLYDVGRSTLRGFYTGARLLRSARGRLRTFTLEGRAREIGLPPDLIPELASADGAESAASVAFEGYDRLADGARIRSRVRFRDLTIELAETFRLVNGDPRQLIHEFASSVPPSGTRLVLRSRGGGGDQPAIGGTSRIPVELPPAETPPPVEPSRLPDPGVIEGSLARPGYRALAYPRPRTASGEDRLLPCALAVDPGDGRVFVASMKMGEIFVLRDPHDDGREAGFEDYAGGLFQEPYSMLADPGALNVLHRRNLTRISDTDGDGRADRFDRLAGLPHGIADTYDYGYGLARDRTGAWVLSFAPYANAHLPGSGGALRLFTGAEPRQEELAFGFRNPLGWTSDPEGEVFATDNQGEWVAANKLVHVTKGCFYGFPNPGKQEHAAAPAGKAAVWIPYDWARSVNGVAFDSTGGKFGPFAGQFFLAELMFGGAIIRVALERVNGEYQGACFPFWGKGLLGPLVLAFDPRGRLYVGGITEPGWMAQPDRGALFRIDFTGETPFEIQSIRVLPRGFRLVFTGPAAAGPARAPASYSIEHYRYEYTGAYGSPELDRTRLAVEGAEPADGGRAVDLRTAPLIRDRIYKISAPGVTSTQGEKLVHPTGVYTLNEIPREER
jgi:hypothetical protein